MSDGYVVFVWRAYGEAMKCLGLRPQEMMGLVTAESRFQANIGNHASAYGGGQMLLSSSFRVEEADLIKPYRDRPECAAAAHLLFKRDKPRFPNGCDLTSLPDNPLKNFIYSGIFYKLAHTEASGTTGLGGATGKDYERINHDLALYFYNAGGSHVRAAVENYRRAVPGGMKTYAVFSQRFPAYLREHFGEGVESYQSDSDKLRRKRNEVAAYANAINDLPKQISQATGKDCGV
jgi:hypothetical protein